MKTILLLILLFSFQATAKLSAQSISISLRNVSISVAMDEISKQTSYEFAFNKRILKNAKPVTLNLQNETLQESLKQLFSNQPFTYTINDKIIIIEENPVSKTNTTTQQSSHEEQQDPIRGRVTDKNGEPLAGTTIRIKGTDITYVTDRNGYFEIPYNYRNATLQVEYIGYRQVEVTAQRASNITLLADQSELDNINIVVNTGYQQLPRERATGSFVFIDSALLNRRVSTNILDRLDGVTSGLIFNTQNLQSIRGGSIEIQGRSTIFANPEPLIILDNFPYDGNINDINPNDIENITVLKDAAAASIWGARAGNGVIVITSKSGAYNRAPSIQVNSNVTIGAKPDLFYAPQLSSGDRIGIEQFLFDQGAYNNTIDNGFGVLTPAVEIFLMGREQLISRQDSLRLITELADTDIRNDLSKYFYQNSINQQHQASIHGGSDIQRYFVSAGYDKNLSNSVGNSTERITINANNTYLLLNKKLEINSGIFYSVTNSDVQNMHTYYISPYEKIADEDGSPLPLTRNLRMSYIETAGDGQLLDWYYRPLEELKERYNINETNASNYRINFSSKYNITPDIGITAMYNFEKGNSDNNVHYRQESYYTRDLINTLTQINPNGSVLYPIPLGGILQNRNDLSRSHSGRLQANYNLTKQNHELYTLIGAEVKDVSTRNMMMTMYGYNPDTEANQNASIDYTALYPEFYGFGTQRISNGSFRVTGTNRYVSYYFNGSYLYNSKYLFSLSARRDESNLFGVKTNQKGVPLWSTGFSWNISNEDFYNSTWLTKLRAGATFGYTGNVDNTLSALLTAQQSSGFIGTYGDIYATIVNPPNPSLRWEKVQNLNFNIEFSAINNRIRGRIDYWTKRGLDLIGNSPIAPQAGIVLFTGNSANTVNRGIDVQLDASILNRNFQWSTTLLFNSVRSRVTKYMVENGTNFDIVSANYNNPLAGYPLYSIFSYEYQGLDENGDPIGILDGDDSMDYSAIHNSTNRNNLLFNGSATPTSFGSIRNTFTYKGFEASFNITYKFGHYFRRRSLTSQVYNNSWRGIADYGKQWSNPGDESSTNIPALRYPANLNRDNIYVYSDALVEKADHIRIQDLRFGYDLKQHSNIPIKNAQFFLYASNIGLLWKASRHDIDPDFTAGFPNPHTIAFGVKADF